jgi:hypothetical protein
MVESIYQFILRYFYFFMDALIIVKIILFIRDKNKSWKFLQFFYFHPFNIMNTEKGKPRKLKRRQNFLSIVILVMLIIQLVATGVWLSRS